MKKTLSLLLFAAVAISAMAVPAAPYPFTVTQPDGTVLTVRMVGDEYHHYLSTLDGKPLLRNAQGFYEENWQAAVEPAEATEARRAPMRRARTTGFPLTGSPRSLVILIGFKNKPFSTSREAFHDLLNKEGYDYNGSTGSCRDYFIASSNGVFTPQFDVYGPYTAEHDLAYYGSNENGNHSSHESDLIIEACQAAKAAGVNFKDFDTNNDNVLDNVFVYYAGNNEAEGGAEETIWPHKSDLSSRNVQIDGVQLATYACTSEFRGSNGTARCNIGTFCHEFSHVLGLPDFYDTGDNYYTVGNWDIMSSGNYNNDGRTPPTFSAYERFYLGWLTPEQLTTPGKRYLSPLETTNTAYLIAANTHNLSGQSPNPNEFFLLEYRAALGWDAPNDALPGTGMLVWHIDYSTTAWSQNAPNVGPNIMRVHLEEANGVTWKQRSKNDSGRGSDPYPGTNKVTTFTPKLHNGTVLEPVFDIDEKNNQISFIYIADGATSLSVDVESLEFVTTMSDTKKIVDWHPQSFTLKGEHLAPNVNVTLKTSGTFYLYAGKTAPTKASNSSWKSSLSLPVAEDSTINQKIWVAFNPVKRNCDITSSAITIQAKGSALSLPVSGLAPRHTYVTTPEVKPVTQITPYSALLSWMPVEDAEEYYITLYRVEEGKSSFVQGFENFSDLNAVHKEGWESNTNLTTTSVKAEGTKSLHLKNTGDQITSQTYQAVITELSFWVNAFTANVDVVGNITVEAWNGEAWKEVIFEAITAKMKKKTLTYTFELQDNYTCFRLTYEDLGGAGIALDAFTATASQKITYIHSGADLSIIAFDDEAFTICYLKDLQPASTYYYQIQATDLDKGCEEHITALSAPQSFQTIAGLDADSRNLTFTIDSINYDKATHTVYLPSPNGGEYLIFFDQSGHQIYSMAVKTSQYAYPVPLDKFIPGHVYTIKYVTDKMHRKGQWVKFIY